MNRKAKARSRRGVAIVVLMVFLAVASSIVISWLRLAGMERRQLINARASAQAEWLAESGIALAVASLRADPAYTGTTWLPSAAELGGRDDGEVLIRIEPVEDAPTRRLITVRADYPIDPARRQRRTKSISIPIETPTEGGS